MDLSETAGFAFRLHQAKDISLANWADNIADHGAILTNKSYTNLGDTSTRSSSAKAAINFGKGNSIFLK